MSRWKLIIAVLFCSVQIGHATSLYSERQYQPLTSDHKAYRVGDVITILVLENASATTSADTTTQKKGGISLGLKTSGGDDKSAKVELSDDFNGGGRIQRSGKLLAQITVTIQSIDPSGNLLVKGDQLIEVNSEKQQIHLEGKIRPSDIGENNTVASTRLADAKISYVGDGILGEKQRPGILSRILSWLGLL